MKKLIIKNEEIKASLGAESPDFPKYVSPIINLANQFAQGTRPKVVGQMTDLIKPFWKSELSEWEDWYLENYPDAIENATDKIIEKIYSLKDALNEIDRETVERWVRDLVIVKTFVGLRFQEVIIRKISEMKGVEYRLSSSDDEAKGIDAYIGNTPISIKPVTYKTMDSLPEEIDVKMIYYEKKKNGISVEFEDF